MQFILPVHFLPYRPTAKKNRSQLWMWLADWKTDLSWQETTCKKFCIEKFIVKWVRLDNLHFLTCSPPQDCQEQSLIKLYYLPNSKCSAVNIFHCVFWLVHTKYRSMQYKYYKYICCLFYVYPTQRANVCILSMVFIHCLLSSNRVDSATQCLSEESHFGLSPGIQKLHRRRFQMRNLLSCSAKSGSQTQLGWVPIQQTS